MITGVCHFVLYMSTREPGDYGFIQSARQYAERIGMRSKARKFCFDNFTLIMS